MSRRRFKIVCVVLLAALVAGGGLAFVLLKRRASRYYEFAIYMNAVNHSCELNGRIPETIEKIEDDWNSYDRCIAEIPCAPSFRRPTFRPIDSLRGGPYLLFIENKPGGLQDWTRMVIYANGDGSSVRYEIVWEWEVDELIREDDALRRRTQTDHAKAAIGTNGESRDEGERWSSWKRWRYDTISTMDYLRIKLRTHSLIAERSVKEGGVDFIELEYSLDMKRQFTVRVYSGDTTPRTREEKTLARQGNIRYSAFQAGYAFNHTQDRFDSIRAHDTPITIPPTKLPDDLTKPELELWLKGWDRGCRAGYRYYNSSPLRTRQAE